MREIITASNPFMGAYTSGPARPAKAAEQKTVELTVEPTQKEQSSLAIFTKAAIMLATADTLQKVKELKDMALTARDWAKRRDAGKEAIQHCQSYALEAERKMGEMLKETELAKGGNPALTGTPMAPVGQTLAKIGISKHQSAKAQKLAALPKETFEAVRDGKKPRAQAMREVEGEKPKAKRQGKLVHCPHCGQDFRL
jgi:hypothetical protein